MSIPMRKIDKRLQAIFNDPIKRREWVKYQLGVSGSNMAQLAEELGVTRQCLYQVFRVPYPRMEKIIADAVGVSPQQLFWERYDRDGLPKRPAYAAPLTKTIKNHNTQTGHRERLSREAA